MSNADCIPFFDPRFQTFYSQPLDDLLQQPDDEAIAQKMLDLFHRSAQTVPAYHKYLMEHGVDLQRIKTINEFKNLPLMTKADYMQAYPLPQRCFGGSLQGADRVAVSSGSTGQPVFWPRSAAYELEVTVRFEQVFRDSFQAHRRSTLAIVCFALGNWVGGLFTTSCCWHLAIKGYPLLVATPGNHKAEILRVIRELAPQFSQTVLLGYPPFLKDVVDYGLAEGIDWANLQTKFVFAGEVFSEEWRNLLGQRSGAGQMCFDYASLYGTADGGVLGNETPLSIAIRRWLAKHPDCARELFGESRLPTLVQYDPRSRYFEEHEGTLAITADNCVPLVRYHIADQGGVIGFTEMKSFLQRQGIDDWQELGLPEDYCPRYLPFVYVFGRADFTISYYGANIYPENVAVGLEQAEICEWTTGKFVLTVEETAMGDKQLTIAVELLPNVDVQERMSIMIAESIKLQLLRLNSEFANYTPVDRQMPHISLHPFADPDHFPLGVKHRYTKSSKSDESGACR